VTVPETRSRQPKPLDAGIFQPEISSFRLHLAAEGKAGQTVRTYTEAVQWFAAAHLIQQRGRTCREEVGKQEVQERVAWLLGRYSAAYASNQYRALQQFFKRHAIEEEIQDSMAGLKPPRVPDNLVPVFASDELARLKQACAGRGFGECRGAAVIAVLEASGVRLSELAGLRYDSDDPQRSDLELWRREITVRGIGDSATSLVPRRPTTPPSSVGGTAAMDRPHPAPLPGARPSADRVRYPVRVAVATHAVAHALARGSSRGFFARVRAKSPR
jgi:site-specific recombinase XerC